MGANMTQNFKQRFNIIKHRGSPKDAMLQTGEKVFRQKELFVVDMTIGQSTYTGFIPCIPYDNHFIYETPKTLNYKSYPSYMCTCGSWAGIFVPESYKNDMTGRGLYFGCYFRQIAFDEDTGKFLHRHADGAS
jgi:hypothetical protein